MASMNMEEQSEEQLESLSREDLVTLVRKLLVEKNEAQKQLETTKKEAGESAKQAEEFCQRNIQLEQEKAKVHADLRQKLAEIEEMEEKSKDIAEKANQIDALLLQLNESRIPVTKTSTTPAVDLPRHRKLPAELDREIFLFLTPAAQRKFIYGLGWDFYAMFRYRLLTKTKRLRNPRGNRWNGTTTRATVAADGLHVSNNTNGHPNVYAEQSFPISGPQCRIDEFPGTILYYYEVNGDLHMSSVGLSGAITDNSSIGDYSNSYAIDIGYSYYECWLVLGGEPHLFELPEEAVELEMKEFGNVFGCGLVLDPDNNLTIFFTLNGQLLGRKLPISPTVDRLFPAVSVWDEFTFEANFGDDPAKSFEYDIHNCPGLELTCI